MSVKYELSLLVEVEKPIVFEVLATLLHDERFKVGLAGTLSDVLSDLTADEVRRQAIRFEIYDVRPARLYREGSFTKRVVE